MRGERERGVALLVVLLLLASVAVIALATTELMSRSLARTGAAQARDRAVWALRGAEAAAATVLEDVAGAQPHKATDRWLAAPLTLPLGGAVVTGRFEDVACFNVNSVVTAGEGGYETPPSPGPGITRFADLVEALGGSRPQAVVLGEAVADFIDADTVPNAGGTEDYDYTRRPVPYRSAGTLIADPSELRVIEGWDRDVYQALRPYLCTLPTTADASVNVNTLEPRDAPILRALLGNALPMGQVERLIESLPPEGYEQTDTFLAPLSNLPATPSLASIATTSTLVSFTASVQGGGQELTMTTLFQLPQAGGSPRVLSRRLGTR